MHRNIQLNRRVPHGALVMLERSAAKVARCVLRGERSREAPDLPGAFMMCGIPATVPGCREIEPAREGRLAQESIR